MISLLLIMYWEAQLACEIILRRLQPSFLIYIKTRFNDGPLVMEVNRQIFPLNKWLALSPPALVYAAGSSGVVLKRQANAALNIKPENRELPASPHTR